MKPAHSRMSKLGLVRQVDDKQVRLLRQTFDRTMASLTGFRMPAYWDCNATTPVDPRVQDEVLRFLREEFGNAGSRTHDFGVRAKHAVERAREQVATVVNADPAEIVFTSGATESNNLAILGLSRFAEKAGRRHIVSTHIEHKAVLEPLAAVADAGFDVTLIRPTGGGWVDPDDVRRALRADTLLVSTMQVNNETGVVQPIGEIGALLSNHDAYFHVDAAQGFGKDIEPLRNSRIDLMSISAHKIFGPKGIGALVARRRGYQRAPLAPLMFGGGQERGLRPGTLAVPLIVGLGLAADLAVKEATNRAAACDAYRKRLLSSIASLEPTVNGDLARTLPHVLNVSFPGLDSEAVVLALKSIAAISNGSACTSQSYQPSHVLVAMQLDEARVRGAVRFSWCHMTEDVDWGEVRSALESLY